MTYPRSQIELIKMARGSRSQREFAELLGVDKSCLSRYENGKLGAPVTVIDKCLVHVANACDASASSADIHQALQHARLAVSYLTSEANREDPKQSDN